ncbi:MAG: HAD family hydrolase, partial [Phycisphaerae bacterium]
GQEAIRRRLLVGIIFGILTLVGDSPLMTSMVPSHVHPGVDWAGLLTACFATVVVCFTGRFFFINAWRAGWHPTMDTLVALGVGAAYLISLVGVIMNLVGGAGGMMHSEFHAAVTIIVLVTLGKYLEARAKAAANAAVAGLAQQSAQTAMIVRADGSTETVPAEQVAIGDRVQVLAHQIVPVDGELIEGAGALDAAIVTGEARPIELRFDGGGPVRHADVPTRASAPLPPQVPGGATLVDGRIVIRATSTAGGSTVARILQMVQDAQASKTQIQGLADRVAAVFTPIVLLLALLTLGGWVMLGSEGWGPGLSAAIATIVIACPCALGLATPTAITVGMARAAQRGILFTNAAALEQAGGGQDGSKKLSGASHQETCPAGPLPHWAWHPRHRSPNQPRGIATVCFDKTGTLTTGQFRVVGVEPAAALAGDELLRLAASLEQFSTHPLAQTMVTEAGRRGVVLEEPENFSSIPGGGIRGQIQGRELVIGSPQWLTTLGVDWAGMSRTVEGLQNQGATLVGVGQVDTASPRPALLGVIGLADTLRPDAAATIATLRVRGIRVGVISGDTAEAVRGALGDIPVDFVMAGVKPEEKAEAVARLRQGDAEGTGMAGGVMFVG